MPNQFTASTSTDAPRNLANVFFLTHSSRSAVDLFRADGTGARFEGGALDAAAATDRFVDEPGVGAGAVAENLAPGVEDTGRVGVPRVVESDELCRVGANGTAP